jgi:hypothetical protein
LPGVTPRGADTTGKIGLTFLEEFQKGGKIGGVVLAVPIHHGGVGTTGGEEAGIEGRTLAEIFREVDDPDAFFLVEEGGGAVLAAVVHRDDLGSRHGGASLSDHGGDVFLFVLERNDEGEFGGHNLFGRE